MNAVVIEHVPLNELPDAWRTRLSVAPGARVTVRIEEEVIGQEVSTITENPLFGICKDRGDVEDVQTYARKLRMPRHQVNDPHRKD